MSSGERSMRRIRGEATLARIFIGESDHHRGRPMVVDARERLGPFLEQVEAMLEEADCGGLITFEKVQTLRYERREPK